VFDIQSASGMVTALELVKSSCMVSWPGCGACKSGNMRAAAIESDGLSYRVRIEVREHEIVRSLHHTRVASVYTSQADKSRAHAGQSTWFYMVNDIGDEVS
jgi:hypothetical protein